MAEGDMEQRVAALEKAVSRMKTPELNSELTQFQWKVGAIKKEVIIFLQNQVDEEIRRAHTVLQDYAKEVGREYAVNGIKTTAANEFQAAVRAALAGFDLEKHRKEIAGRLADVILGREDSGFD